MFRKIKENVLFFFSKIAKHVTIKEIVGIAMKKIISIIMAAILLIGVNMWAGCASIYEMNNGRYV